MNGGFAVNQKMGNLIAEDEAPISEQSRISQSIRDAEKAVIELEKERDALKDENQNLRLQNTQLQIQLDKLNNLLRVKEEEWRSSAEQRCLQQVVSEKSAADAVTKDLEGEMSTLECSLSDTRSWNSVLEVNLQEKRDEVLQLRKELEELKGEICSEREAMKENANNLEEEIESLKTQKRNLEEELQIITQTMISEMNGKIERLKSKLMTRIVAQEKVLSDQSNVLENLSSYYVDMRDGRARKLEEEMEAKVERIRQIEITVEEHKLQLRALEEKHQEALKKLKRATKEKANADREVTRLNEHVKTLEVNLRLLDRKLKISKSEFREKEEMYERRSEEDRRNLSRLEEHCDDLYEEICFREKECGDVREAVAAGVGCTLDGFANLELAFEESFGHFQTRLSECFHELRIMRGGGLRLADFEKKHDEQTRVRIRLRGERLRMAEEETKCLREKLIVKNEEEERSVRVARACEGKVVKLERILSEKEGDGVRLLELERRLKEMEDEVCSKDEEKREAIRQLCILVDYHRQNYDRLLLNLNLSKGGTGS